MRPDLCIDTIPIEASRAELTAVRRRTFGVSNQTWLMIISNIKCQLREIYLVKYKLANKILYKKLFSRISLYLEENISVGVSF